MDQLGCIDYTYWTEQDCITFGGKYFTPAQTEEECIDRYGYGCLLDTFYERALAPKDSLSCTECGGKIIVNFSKLKKN